MRRLAGALLLVVAMTASAEEGLWTLENFPVGKLASSSGIKVDAAWLGRVRAAAVEVGYCSGTFVSANGLVLTEQECVRSCLNAQAAVQRSQSFFGDACRDTAVRKALPLFSTLYCARFDRADRRDPGVSGMLAASVDKEVSCPNLPVQQLLDVEDVSDRLDHALDGVPEKEFAAARLRAGRALEKSCESGKTFRCTLVTLQPGARAWLYKYRIFRDVRVVFAPEDAVAHFGGGEDPFLFPRYAFPAAFVRVYENGKPFSSPFLRLASKGVHEGDDVFLAGSPGSTERYAPAVSLQSERESSDYFLPLVAEARGMLRASARQSDAARAETLQLLPQMDAQIKRARALATFLDARTLEKRRDEDHELQARVAADPALQAEYGGAWDLADSAWRHGILAHKTFAYLEAASFGRLLSIAKTLTRAATERAKPNADRLEGYSDDQLSESEHWLRAPFRYAPELEIQLLGLFMRTLRDELGAHSPVVQKLLQGKDPDEYASELVKGTRLFDPRERLRLWAGGKEAVEASTDPMIVLARRMEPDSRAALKDYLDEVWSPLSHAQLLISRARYRVYGATRYPDGTGTLRLRHGKVRAYASRGTTFTAMTELSGIYGLATGKAPFALPERWLGAKSELELSTPLNFCADTDAVFGQYETDDRGAGFFNAEQELTGMAIGGNPGAAGSRYSVDPELSRTVGLSSGAILQVLEHVYRADALLRELRRR